MSVKEESVLSHLKVGCCGFREARARYMKKFMAVEIQHTFYDPPPLSTLETWKAEAPKGFEFSIKAWQLITHLGTSPTYRRLKTELSDIEREGCGSFQATDVVEHAMEVTLDCARTLKAKYILFQCPASFIPSDAHIEYLREFFRRHKAPKDMRFAWEPRGKWPPALLQSLCQELHLIHVVDPFVTESVTSDLYYYRIHGKRGRAFQFTDEEIRELARTISTEDQTYVFFNNMRMLQDAVRLQEAFDEVKDLPLLDERPRG